MQVLLGFELREPAVATLKSGIKGKDFVRNVYSGVVFYVVTSVKMAVRKSNALEGPP